MSKVFYVAYNSTGDIIAIFLALILLVQIKITTSRDRNANLCTLSVVWLIIGASIINIKTNSIYFKDYFIEANSFLNVLRTFLLMGVVSLYIIESVNICNIEKNTRNRLYIVNFGIYAVYVVLMLTVHMFHIEYIRSDTGYNQLFAGFGIFYIMFAFILLWKYQSQAIAYMRDNLAVMLLISITAIYIQSIYNIRNYTSMVFLIPEIAFVFLYRINPYDINTGALNEKAFNSYIASTYNKNINFVLCSLYMYDIDSGRNMSINLNSAILQFIDNYGKNGYFYKITNGRFLFSFTYQSKVDKMIRLESMQKDMAKLFSVFGIDFKALIMDSNEYLSRTQEYLSFIRYKEAQLKSNEITTVVDKDIDDYIDYKEILDVISDINTQRDLEDDRIVIYCQPVYNLYKDAYDTGEVLVRLRVKNKLVTPDKFINLAEQFGYIHTMSLIILNKVCAFIKETMEEGYNLKRLSINISTMEIQNKQFYYEITDIIDDYDIDYSKIAIEITESTEMGNFQLIEDMMYSLKRLGIKFYLDDFGTGYSNFSRILKLPFNTIKFDKSLLDSMKESKHSKELISTFTEVFKRLNYGILFEGVETDKDAEMCKDLGAKYLQGFRFSKPIAIEDTKNFWQKLN